MQFMEADQRDQLKKMQDPKFKFKYMLEKLEQIRDRRKLQIKKEFMLDKIRNAVSNMADQQARE